VRGKGEGEGRIEKLIGIGSKGMVVRKMGSKKGARGVDAEALLEQLRDVEALLEAALDAVRGDDPVEAERALEGALDIVTDLIIELEEGGEEE
jgi:hypothetical protein